MKKIFLGVCTSLVFSASMNVAASQDIPAAMLAELNQEIQQQYQGVKLTDEQTKAMLTLKADLIRHNENVAKVHGNDEHTLNILQKVNQDKYDKGVAELLTEEQQSTLRFQRRNALYSQISDRDMSRFETEVRNEGRVMELTQAEKEQLLDLKVQLLVDLNKVDRQFAGDKNALEKARHDNFEGYMASLKQLITNQQLQTLNAWRRAGMPDDFEKPNVRHDIPSQDLARFNKEVSDEGAVMNLSQAEKNKLLDLKVDLFKRQSKLNSQYDNDQERKAARRANFDIYLAGFNELTTAKQRDALNKWRQAGRPAVNAAQNLSADVPANDLNRFRQEVANEGAVMKLSEEKKEQLLALKVELFQKQRLVNSQHEGNRARNNARKANFEAYQKGFKELTSWRERRAFNKWVEAGRPVVKGASVSTAKVDRSSVPAGDIARFEKEVADEGKVMKLSAAKKEQLLDLKIELFLKQRTVNSEHSGDQERRTARRANFNAYQAQFNQMTTEKQRRALQQWRKDQRNT